MAKKQRKTNEAYVLVGIVIIALLLLLAYVIHSNRVDERQELSKTERVVNKVQQLKDAKNSVKKLVK